METKHCRKCGTDKPRSEFHKDSNAKSGLTSYCKECNKAKARQWTKDNPEKAREQGRRRAAAGLNRAAIRKRKYGITPREYAALLASQGERCAICGGTASGRKDSTELCVDHDHTSNQIRGLLCHSCNRGIGLLKESPDTLRKAIAYLESPPYQP